MSAEILDNARDDSVCVKGDSPEQVGVVPNLQEVKEKVISYLGQEIPTSF